MNEKEQIAQSESTEEKIKEAAKRVFTRKGYAATRTRDIAEESGYNLALLNYYFRSKEKLFDIIMIEHLQLFIGNVFAILNEKDTSLEEKLERMIGYYIDMLMENPGIPVFIINAVNNDPKLLLERAAGGVDFSATYMAEQWRDIVKKKKLNISPMHLFINIISLTVFPFAASPIIKAKNMLDNDAFNKLMLERKRLIPLWIKATLEVA